MKKIITVATILFSLSLYARSGIKFNSLEHDFGTIQQETVVRFTFLFMNTGNSPLIIERVKTSCGCTGTLLSSKELKPGEQGSLEITFDSGNDIGLTTRTISIFTNDPANKVVKIKIKANIIAAGDE